MQRQRKEMRSPAKLPPISLFTNFMLVRMFNLRRCFVDSCSLSGRILCNDISNYGDTHGEDTQDEATIIINHKYRALFNILIR